MLRSFYRILKKKGQECTRELSRRSYSANEAVEYDFVLFDRGQMAHGVSFMKLKEMSLFNISVLYVPAQIPNRIVNQNSNSLKEKIFDKCKILFPTYTFRDLRLFLCHSRTLGQE